MTEFTGLPGQGDVVTWQRRLADAIIEAEVGWQHAKLADRKRHRHLLRVIGDALVHALLPSHTIRALSRHPAKPPAISSQGDDFDFVFECARQVRSARLIPIVADLTTLIGIGDVVGWGPGGVVVLECKNRTMPTRTSTSGRVARQRQRGEDVETYLSASRLVESDGLVRQAYEAALPSPDFAAVEDLLVRCNASTTMVATHSFGTNDTLIAFSRTASLHDIQGAIPNGEGLGLPAFADYADLVDASDHRLMSPSSYPLPAELRLQLLEGAIHLARCADLGMLTAEFDERNVRAKLLPQRRDGVIEVRLDVAGFEPVAFSHEMINACIWMPVAISDMRQALIENARLLIAHATPAGGLGADMALASGDSVMYATAYRDGSPVEPPAC
jgi:hypothetical protein